MPCSVVDMDVMRQKTEQAEQVLFENCPQQDSPKPGKFFFRDDNILAVTPEHSGDFVESERAF